MSKISRMSPEVRLLENGLEIRRELSSLVASARNSVCLMMYIFANDGAGESFLMELTEAARRGIGVRIILDAFGSMFMPDHLFAPLREAGGQVQRFNRHWHARYLFRNHQKFIIADADTAIVGGFNIADHYFGDGVETGWQEIGIRVRNATVGDVRAYFDRFWEALAQGSRRLRHFARLTRRIEGPGGKVEWLASSPGFRKSLYANRLRKDLTHGSSLSLIMGYFVPTVSLRRTIGRIARRGRVELILPHTTDVPISRYAAWSTFGRLLRDGCEIYEYRPRPLHAKLIVIDDIVYAGSANLDIRSLHLNFEMSLRIHDPGLAAEARKLVEGHKDLSLHITREVYERGRGWFQRLLQRTSYILLSRFDYLITRRFID